MKIVVIIPSRYESTRFPGKPLAIISQRPMIQMVYERASTAKTVTDVIVATDDKRIYDAVISFNGKAIMTSIENRSGTDRAAEASEKLCLNPNDIIINVQGDQPLFDPRSLDEVVKPLLLNDPLISMTTLAIKIVRKDEYTNPKDVKVTFDANNFALYFSRSTIPYDRDNIISPETYKHLGIYAYTSNFLKIFKNLPTGKLETIEKLEQLRAIEYGYKIKVIITTYDSPEVDTPEDICRMETLLHS
ncbi:MAG: 3-deoxy-manno-octulosonate cytidylyltransferase [Desulfobacterales bacterium]|nr:3-deoxy-manno-octulosonate cytidylyltransferase [Desulfobacterales bacterium]MBF0397077.1 3-deoxy-manno-octulosonate cytidylyltransferase [Desulfobacterales bacterium]